MEQKTIRIKTRQLHLDTGEVVPAVVCCCPGAPLEIVPFESAADVALSDTAHVALARCDPHVHFRESAIPTRLEFEQQRNRETDCMATLFAAHQANRAYDVWRGSLAALKGGVWLVGCMGNTPWSPVGRTRWEETLSVYQRRALVYVHVWPRMEPGTAPIDGQETKDFGSTFGGFGLSADERDAMYALYRGRDVSYHNDQPRSDQTIAEFFRQANGPVEERFHRYYDEQTVLECQRTTIALARKHQLRSLLTRHVPTGSAFEMLVHERGTGDLALPIEVGLDYLYWNREMTIGHPTGLINYRRPALPSPAEQAGLAETIRSRSEDQHVTIASDHAPHRPEDKQFKDGLPGSPGTRLLELSHQLHMHLIRHWGFTHQAVDRLTAIHPARYMLPYLRYHLLYPVGTMTAGAMANLCVFIADEPYRVHEPALQQQLNDPHYWSAYRGEQLFGRVLFTVVDGRVWNVTETPAPLN